MVWLVWLVWEGKEGKEGKEGGRRGRREGGGEGGRRTYDVVVFVGSGRRGEERCQSDENREQQKQPHFPNAREKCNNNAIIKASFVV